MHILMHALLLAHFLQFVQNEVLLLCIFCQVSNPNYVIHASLLNDLVHLILGATLVEQSAFLTHC